MSVFGLLTPISLSDWSYQQQMSIELMDFTSIAPSCLRAWHLRQIKNVVLEEFRASEDKIGGGSSETRYQESLWTQKQIWVCLLLMLSLITSLVT